MFSFTHQRASAVRDESIEVNPKWRNADLQITLHSCGHHWRVIMFDYSEMEVDTNKVTMNVQWLNKKKV